MQAIIIQYLSYAGYNYTVSVICTGCIIIQYLSYAGYNYTVSVICTGCIIIQYLSYPYMYRVYMSIRSTTLEGSRMYTGSLVCV